jgi:hypothetical protein
MGILKFLVWTTCAVGLGIFLATGQIDGRTPLDHMERAWKRSTRPSQLERVKDGLEGALDDARDAVGQKTDTPPRERITSEDREAVNRLIAQKK